MQKKTLFFAAALILFSKILLASPQNDVYVIHFILDGLRPDVLQRNLAEGRLPTVQKYFVDSGAGFDRALTVFPTVSPPAHNSFLTGLFPDQSGLVSLEWMDKKKGRVYGYLTGKGRKYLRRDLQGISLLEELSPASAAFYNPFQKGAAREYPRFIPIRFALAAGVTANGLALDKIVMREALHFFKQPSLEWPRYTLISLFGCDYLGHYEGPHSEKIDAALLQFDRFLLQLVEQLAKQKVLDKTYLVLTSDHGMHATEKKFDLRKRLRQLGFNKKDFYLSNRGVSTNALYLHNDKIIGDLVMALQNQPELEWIAVRGDSKTTYVIGSNGTATITTDDRHEQRLYRYHFSGQDPLALGKLPADFHSADVWGPLTAEAEYPDAVVQLGNLFQSERAGDMVVSAKAPWLFRADKAGTHGSLHKEDMRIVLMLHGPTVPVGHYHFARSVDLYPTVRHWFGLEKPPHNMSGKSLF